MRAIEWVWLAYLILKKSVIIRNCQCFAWLFWEIPGKMPFAQLVLFYMSCLFWYRSLQKSLCTVCLLKTTRSNYLTPQLQEVDDQAMPHRSEIINLKWKCKKRDIQGVWQSSVDQDKEADEEWVWLFSRKNTGRTLFLQIFASG